MLNNVPFYFMSVPFTLKIQIHNNGGREERALPHEWQKDNNIGHFCGCMAVAII